MGPSPGRTAVLNTLSLPLSPLQESVLCPTVASYSVGKGWASNPDGSDVLYTVGKTNNMLSGECWDDCAWNGEAYNGTAEDVHLSIEWTQFREWTQDIKNIFTHDLWATEFDKGRCLGPGYIWLRFGHGGPDYLSMHYNRYVTDLGKYRDCAASPCSLRKGVC